MTRAFSGMPDNYRLAVRIAIDANGGSVAGYFDEAIQVALPADRGQQNSLTAALAEFGLRADDRVVYFPLGTDNPPDTLRHHGIGTAACPRGTAPSYWKYRNFYVIGGA